MDWPQSHEGTKEEGKRYKPLTAHEEVVGSKIVDAAFSVHTRLGLGLLERVYEVCLCHELFKRRLTRLGYPINFNVPLIL